MEKIAVIIPTFNRPDYICTALDSILNQTYPNWIAVIANDHSSRDYSEVESKYNDDRIYFMYRDINGGCNAARNTAIDKAIELNADYITLLDDEESFDPRCFEEAIEKIRSHPNHGWFISNNYGDQKKSASQITSESEMDWIDDYVYSRRLKGDKTHFISCKILGDIRFDGRFRSSNMWPFFVPLALRTKIYAYPYPSKRIQYLQDGITRNSSRYPKTLLEVYSRFGEHWFIVKSKPFKLKAYKYLLLEILKTPKRLFILALKNI